MRLASVIVLVLLLSVFSQTTYACKSKTQIVEFGSGGGFTGQYKNYKLDSKGVLYLKKDSTTFERIKTLDKKYTQAVFKDLVALPTADWALNEPGNMTYYITFSNNTAKWGGGKQPSDALKALYKQLSSSTAKENP